MRRTTPDLVGTRKTVYAYISYGLLALTIGYVLWTNYVVFVGGNLPLTPISLGGGSTGAGLTMLFIGDLIAVIALWFLVDGLVLSLVNRVLRTGKRTTTIPAQGDPQWQQSEQTQQWQQQPGPQQQWQPQPQGQQWQSQQPQPQWQQPQQAEPQQQWQSQQPQPQWQQPQQAEPQQQWQQQPAQQWQQQAWPTTSPPSSPPTSGAPQDGSGPTTLVAPHSASPNNPDVPDAYGVNDPGPVHRRWTPPSAR